MSACRLIEWFALGTLAAILSVLCLARPDLDTDASAEDDLSRQLDEELKLARDRGKRKEWIVDELVAGRCSLGEAARTIRDLYPDGTMLRSACREAFPGDTDEEVFARHALMLVSQSRSDAFHRAAVLDRLGAEFYLLYPFASPPAVSWDKSAPPSGRSAAEGTRAIHSNPS